MRLLVVVPTAHWLLPWITDLQANGSGYFNTYSYGLVVALLHADVPVKWAISSTKVKDGIDFSANAKKVAPSVGSTNNYDFKSGPIIILPVMKIRHFQ